MHTIFAFANLLVVPFWGLMIVAPRWSGTEKAVRSPLMFLVPIAIYTVVVLPDVVTLLPAIARPELEVIAPLVGSPRGATIAWTHIVTLDLFAGRWAYLDAEKREVPHRVMGPLLVLMLFFCPIGLGLYFLLRGRWPLVVERYSAQ